MSIFDKIKEFLASFFPDKPQPEVHEEELVDLTQEIEAEQEWAEPIIVSKEEYVRQKLAVNYHREETEISDEEAEAFFAISPEESAKEAEYIRQQFPAGEAGVFRIKGEPLPKEAAIKRADPSRAADVLEFAPVPGAPEVVRAGQFFAVQPDFSDLFAQDKGN